MVAPTTRVTSTGLIAIGHPVTINVVGHIAMGTSSRAITGGLNIATVFARCVENYANNTYSSANIASAIATLSDADDTILPTRICVETCVCANNVGSNVVNSDACNVAIRSG